MDQSQEKVANQEYLDSTLIDQPKFQNVLVMGAQGFIERYLVSYILQQYPQSNVLGLGPLRQCQGYFSHTITGFRGQIPAPLPKALAEIDVCPRYNYRPVDIDDKATLRSVLSEFQPDLVIHLAISSQTAAPESILRHTIDATIVLLDSIVGCQFPPPKVVLGLTSAVYGIPMVGPISEDAPLVPTDLYGVSARATEEITRLFASQHSLPLILARIFPVIGPGQLENPTLESLVQQVISADSSLEQHVTPDLLGSTQDWIDVRDVAQALLLLGERGQAGQVYNIASGREIGVQQVVNQLQCLSGVKINLEKSSDESELKQSESGSHNYVDIHKLSALGFSPTYPLEASLRDILRYYQDLTPMEIGEIGEAVKPPTGMNKRVVLPPLCVQVEEMHTYPVLISEGLVNQLPTHIQHLFPGAQVVVLTDDRVYELYGEKVLQHMTAAGISSNIVRLAEGELAKSMESYNLLIQELYRLRFDRRALLVCLGGGVVSDVGGFVAATYMRGVAYVNVPTTLLAQNDAAIGGKVAVNMPWAKNFIGAFHHPRAVFCDPQVLATQDKRNLAAGIAESVKVAICGDPGLFMLLEQNAQRVLHDRDPLILGEIVHASAQRKIALLNPDPYEVDLRRVLNLGHSFGHALEVEIEFEGLLHGEAVAWGLIVATMISVRRGICAESEAERIYNLLLCYQLPPHLKLDRLHKACQRLEEIRLVRGQNLHFVLPTSISTVQIVPELESGEIAQALNAIADHPLLEHLIFQEREFNSSVLPQSRTLENFDKADVN